MKKFLYTVIVLAFTMTACTSKQVMQEDLSKTEWKLVEYTDGNNYKIDTNDAIIIGFDSTMFFGNAACNQFIGQYSLNESKIKIECIGVTKIFCGEEKEQFEQSYLNALSLELNAEISSNGKELTLKNDENGVSIKYTKCEDTEIP